MVSPVSSSHLKGSSTRSASTTRKAVGDIDPCIIANILLESSKQTSVTVISWFTKVPVTFFLPTRADERVAEMLRAQQACHNNYVGLQEGDGIKYLRYIDACIEAGVDESKCWFNVGRYPRNKKF